MFELFTMNLFFHFRNVFLFHSQPPAVSNRADVCLSKNCFNGTSSVLVENGRRLVTASLGAVLNISLIVLASMKATHTLYHTLHY